MDSVFDVSSVSCPVTKYQGDENLDRSKALKEVPWAMIKENSNFLCSSD